MDNKNYRPRFFLIILIAVIIGQYLSINYMKKDFEDRISQCYDAINTSSIMHGALVNILVEKKILERDQLLKEAENLSIDLKNMIENSKNPDQTE